MSINIFFSPRYKWLFWFLRKNQQSKIVAQGYNIYYKRKEKLLNGTKVMAFVRSPWDTIP